jgi:protein-S-isoprenylcysteine O-methyltransferase Ste14
MMAVVLFGVLFHGAWTNLPLVTAGAALLLLGAAGGVAGVVHLGRNRTPFPKPLADVRLVQHGIYRWMRHPLYTSVIVASLGWALVWQSWPALVSALALAVFFDAKARREERWLRDRFPEYADYARRVRRFIPWVY